MDPMESELDNNAETQPQNPSPKDESVLQGRIFWLPSREDVAKNARKEKLSNDDLWKREVRRGHSRGAIDEGVYNHPIVVVSRPKRESRLVQFLLITSFQGKTLDEMFDKKDNKRQASMRTWYLPVSPTPDHPDINSENTKKRYPTLCLANGAVLRKNSYVDISNVYQIDWSLLKEYKNPESPDVDIFRLEKESWDRMIKKCEKLVEYVPEEQLYKYPKTKRSRRRRGDDDNGSLSRSSTTEATFEPQSSSALPGSPESDFCRERSETTPIPPTPPKIPPDPRIEIVGMTFINDTFIRPLDQFLESVNIGKVAPNQQPVGLLVDPVEMRQSFNRFWSDVKGVMAVVIASI